MGYPNGNDNYVDWNSLNTQFEMGMAQSKARNARVRAAQAEEEAEEAQGVAQSWRAEAHLLRRKFVELSKNAYLTAQNRDAWAATARQLWKLAYPNKTEEEVRGLMRTHLDRIKRERPYDGVEVTYWKQW